MHEPVLTLFDATMRQRLRRPTFWLVCGLYVVIVLAVIYPVSMLSWGGISRLMFQTLQVLHFLVAAAVPAFLASSVVDDVSSGTLELAKVAGLSSAEWISFRLLSIFAPYFAVWTLRLPLYALILNTGGATASEMLWAEALHWTLALSVAQTSLLIARYSIVAPAAIGVSITMLLVMNAALFVPTAVVVLAGRAWGIPIPAFVNIANDALRSLSMLSYLLEPPRLVETQLAAAGGIALHLLVGATATFWLRRLLFIQAEPGTLLVAGLRKQAEPATTRPSRRVWDDALAWQAAVFHSGSTPRSPRILGWLLGAAALVISAQPWALRFPSSMVGFWLVFALAAPGMVPATCVALERKHNTLSSLAMLPFGGRDIYAGWLRGNRSKRAGAWIAAGACFAVAVWQKPLEAPVWALAGLMGAFGLPPLAFLESLEGNENGRRVAAKIGLGICFALLASGAGILLTALTATLAACCYRPRAVRLMDRRFEAASAR